MTNDKFQSPDGFIPAGQLVQAGQPYWVQCTDFKCRAVVGKAGRWKDLATGKRLPDVINVFAAL
jgi:hypothetical protein